jgi:hypothetical protein
MSRRSLVLALATLATLAISAGARAQSRLDFSLVNRTGYEISEVYVGPTSSSSWGRDILGQDTLPNAQTVNIGFNRNASTCMWDVKVVYSDRDETEWRNVNLCNISRMTLFWNRQAGTTRAVTE